MNECSSGKLELSIAGKRSDEYEEIVQASKVGCDCQDFEACLKVGIQWFDWIIAADERYRSALYDGKASYDKGTEDALERYLRNWHQKSAIVLDRAAHYGSLGFELSGLAEFQRRCEEAAAMVDSLDESEHDGIMSEPLIILRDQALHEHRNDQTAEFI